MCVLSPIPLRGLWVVAVRGTTEAKINAAREDARLAKEAYDTVGAMRGRTDWGRCESRHQRARLEERLGTKRPLTNWEEGNRSVDRNP